MAASDLYSQDPSQRRNQSSPEPRLGRVASALLLFQNCDVGLLSSAETSHPRMVYRTVLWLAGVKGWLIWTPTPGNCSARSRFSTVAPDSTSAHRSDEEAVVDLFVKLNEKIEAVSTLIAKSLTDLLDSRIKIHGISMSYDWPSEVMYSPPGPLRVIISRRTRSMNEATDILCNTRRTSFGTP